MADVGVDPGCWGGHNVDRLWAEGNTLANTRATGTTSTPGDTNFTTNEHASEYAYQHANICAPTANIYSNAYPITDTLPAD